MAPLPSHARFVLTGPSGWIGSAMLARLARRTGGPLAERVQVFASVERAMDLPSGERLQVRDLKSISPADVEGAHVIHLAYLTREKAEELGEREFSDTNLAIDDAVLSALAGARPASMFVASSGAAAMAARGVDLHPYGLAKLRQEARFLDWGPKAGVPVIAGRIFNIAGPHINKLEAYAISNFALQAQSKRAITVQAQIPVFRSFLHVNDLCDLVIEAGLHGIGRARPIDLCGCEVVEMGDIAALVSTAAGQVPIQRGPVDHRRSSVYLGDFTDTKILAMELGFDLSPLSMQVQDTIAWLTDGGMAAGAGG